MEQLNSVIDDELFPTGGQALSLQPVASATLLAHFFFYFSVGEDLYPYTTYRVNRVIRKGGSNARCEI